MRKKNTPHEEKKESFQGDDKYGEEDVINMYR